MTEEIIPISMRRIKGASPFEFTQKSMETETTTWSKFTNRGKAIVEQKLGLKDRNKSKRAGLWESQSGIRERNLEFWKKSFEYKNYNRVHKVY